MPYETEIKLAIPDPKALQRRLKRLGVKPQNPKAPRVHEMNLLFDTPDGGLAKHGQLLRIRTESPAAAKKSPKVKTPSRTLLTFKSPPDQLAIGDLHHDGNPNRRYKIREEIEAELPDGAALKKIFEGLGLRGWFRYEKFRTTYILPARHRWANGLLIEVDETPIGLFVELEGPGEAIDRAASELGFSRRDYILKNYLVLYLDDCKRQGKQPTHMLFDSKNLA
ncbi:MAG TPA: class IV adenylate cyclase [Candidatus Acidoferrum sp.]|nr:class IV adenylate cyclase [Candidatus Acidoferrum sp.]